MTRGENWTDRIEISTFEEFFFSEVQNNSNFIPKK